jgi:hypothetical protein
MAGIPTISGGGASLSQIQFEAAHQAKVMKLQLDVANDLNAAALKLIEASLDGVGTNLDVSA